MKAVYQQIVDHEHGDCWKAAVASVLELNYDDIPILDPSTPNYFLMCRMFMGKMDLVIDRILWNGNLEGDISKEVDFTNLKDFSGFNGFFLATVASPAFHNPGMSAYMNVMSGNGHSVVIDKDFNIVHDPNPNNRGLKKYPFADQIGHNGVVAVELYRKQRLSDRHLRHTPEFSKIFDVIETQKV